MERNIKMLILRFTCKILLVILIFLLMTMLLSWKGFINQKGNRFVTFSNRNNKSVTEQAQKITKVSFLKVGKCGSSSVACILLRFGVNNNLSMFLPKSKSFVSSKEQSQLLKSKEKYDIFAIHTFYNCTFFQNIVNNPISIAIIRRPEESLISYVTYFRINEKDKRVRGLGLEKAINKIVENTSEFGVDNRIASFFGIQDFNIPSKSLQHYLMKLNSEFSLVIILERFDECLILLKRLMHWSVFDIIYKAKKGSTHNTIHLNKQQMERLRYTNRIEYAIYEFFYNEIEKKIKNAKQDFTGVVARFKDILTQTDDFCLSPDKSLPYHSFQSSKWDNGFSITDKDCLLIYKFDVGIYKRVFGK